MVKSGDQKNLADKVNESEKQKDSDKGVGSQDSFFADLLSDIYSQEQGTGLGNSAKGISILNSPLSQIKAQLRTKILGSLTEGFVVPELVEGLVEFLLEIVKEDPHQAKLFGLAE